MCKSKIVTFLQCLNSDGTNRTLIFYAPHYQTLFDTIPSQFHPLLVLINHSHLFLKSFTPFSFSVQHEEVFPTNIVYAFLFSTTRSLCLAHQSFIIFFYV